MKKLFSFLVLAHIASFSFSQIDERVFGQVGGTILADITQSSGSILGEKFETYNINFASFMFAGRINFLEISNNTSLSLSAVPTLSVGGAFNDIGASANFSFRLPLLIDFNYGTAATIVTRKNGGIAFSLGAQYSRYPLFPNGTAAVAKDRNGKILSMSAYWIEPVMSVGYKFFGKHYYCREINLRASYALPMGEVNNDTKQIKSNIDDFKSMGVMISFMQYINY